MRWRLGLLLLCVGKAALAGELCPQWLSELRLRKSQASDATAHVFQVGDVHVRANKGEFSVEKGEFALRAFLIEEQIEFVITTKPESGQRDPDFRGKELFDAMMEHFGTRPTAVRGTWQRYVKGLSEYYPDNYRLFAEAEARGASPEQAALETWTGQQACRWGFCHPVVVIEPGLLRTVETEFYRTAAEADRRREELRTEPAP